MPPSESDTARIASGNVPNETQPCLATGAKVDRPAGDSLRPDAEFGTVPSLSTEEQLLVSELVADGLAIQERFSPEPRYKDAVAGNTETNSVEEIRSAAEMFRVAARH